jgi:hypothetical protein
MEKSSHFLLGLEVFFTDPVRKRHIDATDHTPRSRTPPGIQADVRNNRIGRGSQLNKFDRFQDKCPRKKQESQPGKETAEMASHQLHLFARIDECRFFAALVCLEKEKITAIRPPAEDSNAGSGVLLPS